jgi:protein TonB
MKKIITAAFVTLAVSACSSTSESSLHSKYSNFVDITKESSNQANKSNDNSYWKVKHRGQIPRYPIAAAERQQTGCVVLDVAINKQGKLEDYKVVESFPKKLFDKSAIQSLKTWQWEPTENNTSNQQVISRVKIDYSLANATTNTNLAKGGKVNSVCSNYDASLMHS